MKPQTLKNCPVCDYVGDIKPSQRTFEHATIEGVSKGKWWQYVCPKCKFQFTTTESDTISMDKWKNETIR